MAKRTTLRMMAASVCFILFCGIACADLSDGLMAYWTFDEGMGSTAYDSAGNNDGTLNGATWTAGRIENALDFDGANDFVSVPANPSLDFSHSYTISAWLKPTENPSHAMVWFGYHGGVPYGPNYYRSIHFRMYPNGQIRCGLYGDALNTTSGIVTFGEWNHIVYSYDYGTEKASIIVNNQLVVSGTLEPYVGGLRTATIGKWDVDFQSQENFDGLMDEFMVYGRALSAEEIQQLYLLEIPELLGIEIIGSDQAAESFPTPYKAIAYYDDNSTREVTASANWFVEPVAMANITGGVLTAEKIDLPTVVTIKAQYSQGENGQQAEKQVSILPICPGGSALKYDGVNDYIKLPSILNPAESSFSAFAWVRLDTKSTAYQAILQQEDEDTYHPGRTWLFRGPDDTLRCSIGGNLTISPVPVFSTPSQWVHVGVMYDGQTVNLYANGQWVASSTKQAETCMGEMLIGAPKSPQNPLNFWNGLIDDVRIYDRVISVEEVQVLMHTRPTMDDPALVGYWSFDEGQGQTAADWSAYSNHGTLGSSPDEDGSDPVWVASDAPVGICTLDGLVGRGLNKIRDRKFGILEELAALIEKEDALLGYMDEAFRNGTFDNLTKKDVVQAKQKIHGAVQHEKQAQAAIDRSIDKIDDAMNALGIEPNSPE